MSLLARPCQAALFLAFVAVVALPGVAGAEVDSTSQLPVPASGDPQTVLTILEEIGQFFFHQVNGSEHQWLIALVAFGLGVLLVVNGYKVYEWVLILSVGVVAMIMTTNFMTALWDLERLNPLRFIVGVEVGVILSYATWKGIHGMNIAVGLAFGFLVARWFQGMLLVLGCTWIDTMKGNHWVLVIFYTLVTAFIGLVFRKEGHLMCLAIISPIIGGACVSSAVSWGITAMADHWLVSLHKVAPALAPVPAPWVSFLTLLIISRSRDVGVFANSPYNPAATIWTTDRMAGWFLWLVTAGAGMYLQTKRRSRSQSNLVSARELQRPLMPDPEE